MKLVTVMWAGSSESTIHLLYLMLGWEEQVSSFLSRQYRERSLDYQFSNLHWAVWPAPKRMTYSWVAPSSEARLNVPQTSLASVKPDHYLKDITLPSVHLQPDGNVQVTRHHRWGYEPKVLVDSKLPAHITLLKYKLWPDFLAVHPLHYRTFQASKHTLIRLLEYCFHYL